MKAERNFGLIFAGVFLLVAAWPLGQGSAPRWWAVAVAGAFATAALLFPATLSVPNRLWRRLGDAMHMIMSPIILLLLFFAILTPVGLVARLLRKDPLRRAAEPGLPSYWIVRERQRLPPDSFRVQF